MHEETTTKTFEETISWDAEYDVFVVGFGAAGAVSAITAAEQGAKVLLLEKAPLGEEGGSSIPDRNGRHRQSRR